MLEGFGCTTRVGSTGRVSVLERVRVWLCSPVTQTDLLQIVKAVAAAVAAWVLAELVLELRQAFLAPWVALLTVHVTAYRTVWRGAQTVLAVTIGILLSVVVVEVFDVTPWSLGLALLVGLGLARVKVLHDEDTTIATTVLIVITTGYQFSDQRAVNLLPDRFLSTTIGVAVAVLVNLLVLAPLNDRGARQQIDDIDHRLGTLLMDVARQLREPEACQEEDDWIERTRSIDTDIDQAWSVVRTAQESRFWNPRRRRHSAGQLQGYPQILLRLEEGVSRTRSIARHVRESNRGAQEWDVRFANGFISLLDQVGHRIADPHADANAAELRRDLHNLAQDLSTEDLSGLLWPLYGALIANLQIVVDVVDDVATAQQVHT